MEHLATCHPMNGFLRVPTSDSHRRGQHASAPSCQHVKRSLSLADRRGLISPARDNGRGFISAVTSSSHTNGVSGGMTRRIHHADEHSLGHMQNMAFLLPIMDANCALRLPTLEFSAKKRFCEGIRKRGQSAENFVKASEGRDRLGHVLIRLHYSQQRLSVRVLCLSVPLPFASAPSLLVWLFRAGRGTLEKCDTAQATLRRGGAWASERWEFEAQREELGGMALLIMVKDSFAEVGHCILGESLGADATGVRHWHEATNRPGQSVTQWHRLSAKW